MDAGAAGVVEPHQRGADLHRHVHDLADLVAHRPTQAASEHREVLGEDEHGAAVDLAEAGHDCVAPRALVLDAEAARVVADQHVDLLERALVEQQLDPLPGGELALFVLPVDGALAPGVECLLAQPPELLDTLLGPHDAPLDSLVAV